MSARESFGSSMDRELLNTLREVSKETGIPLSKLFDKAVELLINENYKEFKHKKNDSV